MIACATTKHQGSYVTSLKVNSNTNISSIYKYIDIIKTLKNTLSLHSELIMSTSPWKIEKDLGFISFEDITCLDKIEYDVYGAWDEFGYIIYYSSSPICIT